jgi:hypothetical protein
MSSRFTARLRAIRSSRSDILIMLSSVVAMFVFKLWASHSPYRYPSTGVPLNTGIKESLTFWLIAPMARLGSEMNTLGQIICIIIFTVVAMYLSVSFRKFRSERSASRTTVE